MSTISSTSGGPVLQASGIGSGLDVQGIVSKLVAAEIDPLQQQLSARQSTLNGEVSAFGTLSGVLSSLESAMTSLMDSTAFQQKAATSSATSYVTATADSTAALGSYNVQVTQLASQEKMRVTAGNASTTAALGWNAGTLTINSGNYDKANNTFTASGTSFNINITSSDSLSSIASQINSAGAGVTATIVNDGTNNYLTLTSNSTGANNAFSLGGTVTIGSTTPTALTYDPTNPTATTTNTTGISDALDGQATIDGLATTSSTNTITGAVQGVSFALAGLGTSTVTVGADTSATKNTITSFVDAYNKVITTINSLSKYVQGGTSGPLLSDSMVSDLKSKLQEIMGGSSTNSGVYSTLTQLGYATNTTDGTLYLKNSSDLDNALASNFNDVGTMMASYANSVNTLVSAYTGTTGLISGRTDSLNTMLKSLQDQQDQLTLRQQSLTDTYTKQYSALDGTIATMNSTMSYLQQQLAKLPG